MQDGPKTMCAVSALTVNQMARASQAKCNVGAGDARVKPSDQAVKNAP